MSNRYVNGRPAPIEECVALCQKPDGAYVNLRAWTSSGLLSYAKKNKYRIVMMFWRVL